MESMCSMNRLQGEVQVILDRSLQSRHFAPDLLCAASYRAALTRSKPHLTRLARTLGSAQVDVAKRAEKATQEAIQLKTKELNHLMADLAEVEKDFVKKRREVLREREEQLAPLREELSALRAALKEANEATTEVGPPKA